MELMLTIAAYVCALQLIWTWSLRGGSIIINGETIQTPRFLNLFATPFVMWLALFVGLKPDPVFLEQDPLYAEIGLFTGCLLFLAAQTPGWGRQMDLGRDSKPDDEWGYQIRDWMWGKNNASTFWRDLTGLYMRFSLFLPGAVIMSLFFHPLAGLATAVLAVTAPLVWVVEDFMFYRKGKQPHGPLFLHSWTEFVTGLILAVATIVTLSTL